MSSQGDDLDTVDWEALFHDETPYHIRESHATMDTEILGEFQLKLGPEVTILNYRHLKFILSRAMREREIFGHLMKIIVSTFKEDAEKSLVHMRDLMQISEPPF